jgi:hypothetical protein
MKAAEAAAAVRAAAGKRRQIRDKYCPGRLGGAGAADIRNVLVIQSASRSGSSFLYRLLSGHPDVISLNGEDIVFHKLNGVGSVASAADSDSLPPGFDPGPAVLARIAGDILLDSGCVHPAGEPFSAENFAADCAQRFLLQWPGEATAPDELYAYALSAIEGAGTGAGFDHRLAWAAFLKFLAGRGVKADPWRYDLRPELIRSFFPQAEPEPGPPLKGGLEDTPFVIPEPRTFPGAAAAGEKTLLLKSSSNCYRAEFIKKLFPGARFRFVRLARNPMAAVSGLMDGWQSGGFFSHDLGGIAELGIAGYSSPAAPWTGNWWKFDLPPGWADYCRKPLAEVCAFQWLSANRRILEDSAAGLLGEPLRVRYEDLLEPARLRLELARIAAFAGLRPDGAAAGRSADPVMAVTRPRPHKWLKRKEELLPLCASRELREVSSELGYDLDGAEGLP